MGKIEIDHTGSGSGVTLSSDGTDLLLDGTAIGGGGGGGGIASVVADTTPQLGGNLDTNSKNIAFGDSTGATVNRLTFGAGDDLVIYHDNSTNKTHITESGSSHLIIQGQEIQFKNQSGTNLLHMNSAQCELFFNGSKKFETNTNGITITGLVEATTLTGDGSGLTSLPAQFGYPSDQSFTVTNSGSGAYTFAGGASGDNATLTLIRGRTYKFSVNASGHPFRINTSNTTGTGAAYVNGTAVINNGAAVGDIYFTVPDTAPDTLYYNCEYHSSMAGTINVSNALKIDKANGNVLVDGKINVTGNSPAGIYFENNNTRIYHGGHRLLEGSTSSTSVVSLAEGYTGYLYCEPTIRARRGISFGTDTATANQLDDYEEGTWTPSIKVENAGAAGITVNHATYTKIGRLVSLVFDVTINSVTGTNSSRAIQLEGMPFTINTAYGGGPNIGYTNLTNGMSGNLALQGRLNNRYRIVNLTGATGQNASDHIQATTVLRGQFIYHTDQ